MGYWLIFPGQGTQFPGMSRGLEITGAIPGTLRRLMEEGPAEELDLTLNAQPAVLSVSAALWKRSGLTDPLCVMGHSLGEYTALVAAGSLDLDEAVALVTKRAVLMEASSPRKGSMAAVVGLSAGEVAKVCALFEDLWVANLNGASQVVISGRAESVDAAVPALKERGARKVVPLKVSVASHCPYMEQASAKLAEHLGSVGLGRPSCPVISNVTAGPET
ncbi:MAG TPA: acyltransferase domain-containing protein, partial [Deltaproteobacteria bacterium]|nr:acyltransferase domain-containing protein [Deltaproteobacteria bacterium]